MTQRRLGVSHFWMSSLTTLFKLCLPTKNTTRHTKPKYLAPTKGGQKSLYSVAGKRNRNFVQLLPYSIKFFAFINPALTRQLSKILWYDVN